MTHLCFKFLATVLLLITLSGCFAAPEYEGERSDHFDGEVFVNREPMNKGPFDMLKLGFGFVTQAKPWPAWIENTPADPIPHKVIDGIRITYINHATTLIQMDGINILTDPIYSDRASPLSFAGPKRIRAPGIPLDELPPIDVILISHNHYDHLDIETLQNLNTQQEQPPLILAGLGNGKLFEQSKLPEHVDLDWNESFALNEIEFTFVECRHRSGRGIGDQMKTLWGSFVIKSDTGSIYFAGDTGYGPHLKEHGEQFGPFDLSILPIGAYEPRWFMKDVHLNPEEAVEAHLDLGSKQSLGIHFGVFQLTYEAVSDPETALATALAAKQIRSDKFWQLEPGKSRSIKSSQQAN